MTERNDPELLTARAAASRLGKHPRTLARWSDQGILPEPVRLGPRADRHYLAENIAAIIENGAA